MIKPIFNKVVVKPLRAEEKSPGGIILPNANENAPETGDVQDVGPDCKAIKKGDIALFAKYVGQEFEYKKSVYLILAEHDIISIITKD